MRLLAAGAANMTAEIAVLNRAAVALAADSASTLISAAGVKVNNSAEKLFHLCDHDPVGIMIFGNAEFMDIPFEPIIKEFRCSDLASPKEKLTGYADAFFEYLEGRLAVGADTCNMHIHNVTRSALEPLVKRAYDRLISNGIKQNESVPEQIGDLFVDELRQKNTELAAEADCETLNDEDADHLSALHRDEVAAVLCELMLPRGADGFARQDIMVEAARFIGLHLKKGVYSELSTGIALAGFGTTEQFPSLQVYHTEGLVRGRVKRTLIDAVHISPTGQRGHVAPLAQDDVVKRYVEGVDPKLGQELAGELRRAMREFGAALADSWLKGPRRKNAREQAAAAADRLATDFLRKVVDEAKDRQRQKIIEVVTYMSKSELAQLAEALVEMTALRRRVSMEAETVGGPVDVAVVSRGDGFVWIKRKHYFDAELNPRYFASQERTMAARRAP
jgi:hypothetical protein